MNLQIKVIHILYMSPGLFWVKLSNSVLIEMITISSSNWR